MEADAMDHESGTREAYLLRYRLFAPDLLVVEYANVLEEDAAQ
jgi:hypothetical protein